MADGRAVDKMASTSQPPAASRKVSLVRSFGHRNYRLFFMGQGVSLIGTWMQNLALSWLVYSLTGSKLLLGVVGFTAQILTFLAAPFAGVLADRVNKRALLVVTQSTALVQALILATLTLMKHADGTPLIRVWHIIALSALLGLVNGFDMPARQSFVVEMLEDRADLPNAIALNSFMFNGARLIGPSLAGIVIKLAGEGVCFLLNAVSFLAVIAALLAMRVQPKSAEAAGRRVLHSLKEGAQYVAGHKPILSLLLLLATLSLVGMPYAVLMPVFAKDILHGDSFTQGCLTSAVAVGAIIAAIFLASREQRARPGKDSHRGGGALRRGGARLLALDAPVAFAWAAGLHRLCHHDADGLVQHADPDAGGRRQARARDELLHDFVRRAGAVRQPARRRAGGAARRAGGRVHQRPRLPRRRDRLLDMAAAISDLDPAGVRQDGNCGRGRVSLRPAHRVAFMQLKWDLGMSIGRDVARGMLVIAAAAALGALGACNVPEMVRFPDYVGPAGPAQAQEAAAAESSPPAPPPAPAEAAGPLRVAVPDAILLALQNNRAFIVDRYNTPITRTAEQQQLAAFDPDLTGTFSIARGFNQVDSPPPEQTELGLLGLSEFLPTGTLLNLSAGETA